MDGEEQARIYAAADFSSSDAALVERILSLASPSRLGPRVLDLGCGPGNISFRLAEQLRQAEILGLDGAPAMLAIAEQRRLAQPRRWPSLRFRCLRLPPTQETAAELTGRFTAVISNSVLHHLHEPADFWRSVRRFAARGARLHVHDLRRPADEEELEALVRRHAADAPALLQHDYRASLRAAFRPEEVRVQLHQAGLHHLDVMPLEDRYLEVSGDLP